jgi:hypothetical protein
MSVVKSVATAVAALAVASVLLGLVFESYRVTFVIPAALYLALCFAQASHSIEEYLTRFWVHIFEAPLLPFSRTYQSRGPGKVSRVSFVAFNIAFDGVMFLFYPFLLQGAAWSWVFVLGTALVGVGNAVLHCGTALLKRAYFSGCVTAIFTLLAGSLTLAFTTVRL